MIVQSTLYKKKEKDKKYKKKSKNREGKNNRKNLGNVKTH